METRITQCPGCGTSFRVTDALLAVAAGAVRCGSCLHIFNAREHWLDDKPAAPTPPLTTSRVAAQSQDTTAAPQARREPIIDEDALFDDDSPLFDDDEEEDDERRIFNPSSTDFTTADGDEADESNKFLDTDDWLTPNSIDFSTSFNSGADSRNGDEEVNDDWAEELLRDDAPRRGGLSTTDAATDNPFNDDGFNTANTTPLSEADRNIKRLSIISDYQLEHDDILAQVPLTHEGDTKLSDEINDILLDLPTAFDPGLRDAPKTETELEGSESQAANFSAGERIGEENDTDSALPPSLRKLNTEPLRTFQFVREKRWPKLLWGAGLVIGLGLLPAQYLYFNFNNLARGDLRPWLANACDLIGCQLPPQSDPAHIRTGSLIVRSHPTTRGALAVDAIITNLAPFAQPYPELVLQFTDINGSPVAGRRFHPAEYLGGELKGSHLMPIGQPIHIGLEVKDPGPRAVNYLLAVSPAED